MPDIAQSKCEIYCFNAINAHKMRLASTKCIHAPVLMNSLIQNSLRKMVRFPKFSHQIQKYISTHIRSSIYNVPYLYCTLVLDNM